MAAKFDRGVRIATLERVLMTGDVVEDGDFDTLDEMLRELRAEAAKPIEIARATAHHVLPVVGKSSDTATCIIEQNDACNFTRIVVSNTFDDLIVVEHGDYDGACEIAYMKIMRRYDSSDVDWRAEARALHAAMEQVH